MFSHISRLRAWQQGFIYGFLFTLCTALIYLVFLVIFEFRVESLGLPHYCYAITSYSQCPFFDALLSKAGSSIMIAIVFGIPIGIAGALIGAAIDRVKLG